MPLRKGVKFIGSNISELMHHGHSQVQSVAIALKVAGKSNQQNRGKIDGFHPHHRK
jgi:hypothetical protein